LKNEPHIKNGVLGVNKKDKVSLLDKWKTKNVEKMKKEIEKYLKL
jgi:hypothetical protein